MAARKKQAAGRPCKQRAGRAAAPTAPLDLPLWICPFGSVVRSPVEQEAEAEEEEAAAAAAAAEEEEEEEGDYALAKHWKQLGLA
eukprot:COSAG06_NODE_3197_length_5701_cov_5.984470_4_plen_85_part_00